MNSTLKTGFSISCFFIFIACTFTILHITIKSQFGALAIVFWVLALLIFGITISYNDYQNKQKRKILPV